VRNNPINYLDPFGLSEVAGVSASNLASLLEQLRKAKDALDSAQITEKH